MSPDRLLNLVAIVLLRARPPLEAHAILKRVGRLLPPHRGREDVLRAAGRLGPRGTCLSRALALAARTPGAAVVIGVRPEPGTIEAHAWVELDGRPLRATDPSGEEIARLV